MAESIFDTLRQLGATVDVRRVDGDGGLALVGLTGSRVAVEVYHDARSWAAILDSEVGDHARLDAAQPDTVAALVRGMGAL